MSVDPAFARWLREGAIYAEATDAAIEVLWAELARVTEAMSPLALQADAEAEAARQVEFLGGPLVIDRHLVAGLKSYLIACPVTIKGDRLGYAGGVSVFVIGVAEQAGADHTQLTVLRKLS